MASEQGQAKLKGRPRVKANLEILLEARRQGLGWVLAAAAYQQKTGQFISPSTVRRLILANREGERR